MTQSIPHERPSHFFRRMEYHGGVYTPPESPDCNPIENMWHELKEYIRREVQPKSKQELIDGIEHFWTTVDAAKCCRYINHVLPKVVAVQGEATGY